MKSVFLRELNPFMSSHSKVSFAFLSEREYGTSMMTPIAITSLSTTVSLFMIVLPVSVLAGGAGAILGLGGGIILVPFLTLVMNVDIQTAIATSLISIVATSSGAAASYLKDRLTNIRLAVLLELGTVSGAMTGFFLHRYIPQYFLFTLFGFFIFWSAVQMFKQRHQSEVPQGVANHAWSERLGLSSEVRDSETGQMRPYAVARVPLGLVAMYGAGIMSALLGIGSGSLKVLAMDGAMRLPLRVSSATSNFMIGVTAAASGGAFLLEGAVNTRLAVPVALGVLIGSMLGARLMPSLSVKKIRLAFVGVLLVISIQMLWKGIGGLLV